MRRFVILVSCMAGLLALEGHAQDSSPLDRIKALGNKPGDQAKADVSHAKAMREYKKKNYQGAAEHWAQAAEYNPAWWKPFYNMACLLVIGHDRAEAVGFLKLALDRNFTLPVIQQIKNDSDLAPLVKEEAYMQLFEKKYREAFGGHWVMDLLNKNFLLSSKYAAPSPTLRCMDDDFDFTLILYPWGDVAIQGKGTQGGSGYPYNYNSGLWYVHQGVLYIRYRENCDIAELKKRDKDKGEIFWSDASNISECKNMFPGNWMMWEFKNKSDFLKAFNTPGNNK